METDLQAIIDEVRSMETPETASQNAQTAETPAQAVGEPKPKSRKRLRAAEKKPKKEKKAKRSEATGQAEEAPGQAKKRLPLPVRIAAKLLGLLFIGLAAALTFLITANVLDNSTFETTFYRMTSPKINTPIRIVVLSDLHCWEYGERNADLIAEISNLEPDMIAIVGDMMNDYQEDYSVVINLLNDLQALDIAPIFYSYGNHEKDTWYNINPKLDEDIRATGVNVYSDSFDTVEINGNSIVIGGLTTGSENYYKYWASNFIKKFVAMDGFKLLLCHFPDYFVHIFNAGNPLDADLALCGHAHGGLVRIPGIGGLIAPDQGLFPDLTEGMRTVGGCTVVVSRGLGGRVYLPRINNKPELVVVDLD